VESCNTSFADLSSGIERVKHFKLLGINISHDFSWQTHVDVITSKAATGNSLGQLPEQNVYIFSSVFAVKLSIDWINKFFYFFVCI